MERNVCAAAEDGGCAAINETQLLIKAEIQLEAADAYALDPEQAEAWQKTQRENADYTVLEELPWCADGRGVIQGKRMRLFVYDTLTTELFPLTDPRMNCGSVSACPELGKALFTGMTYEQKASQREGLYCFDAQTGSVTTLIEEGVYRRIKEPRFVSGTVVFAATDGLRYGKNESLNFYTLNPDTGAVTLLAKLDDPLGSSIGYRLPVKQRQCGKNRDGDFALLYDDSRLDDAFIPA